jgi:hypothetical protein
MSHFLNIYSDMELRAKESSKPHIAGTVGDLIAGIFNPNEQRCILDCVISTGLPQDLTCVQSHFYLFGH